MLGINRSSKLASLLRLCFAAGIVSLSGVASGVDCTTDASICTQPGLRHDLPTICQLYPGDVQCLGGWGTAQPQEGTVAAASLEDAMHFNTLQLPHIQGNNVQAGCSSALETRLASALADVRAWWPTLTDDPNRPTFVQSMFVTVKYSNGQREIWAVAFNSSDGSNLGINNDPRLGKGGLISIAGDPYIQDYIHYGGIYGGGPGVFQFCGPYDPTWNH